MLVATDVQIVTPGTMEISEGNRNKFEDFLLEPHREKIIHKISVSNLQPCLMNPLFVLAICKL